MENFSFGDKAIFAVCTTVNCVLFCYLCTTLGIIDTTMELILISIVMLGLAFAGIAIKILVKKNGQFAGTCSSNNPLLQNDSGSCSICGAQPAEQCGNKDA